MLEYKLMSRFLDYPDQELKSHLDEIELLLDDASLAEEERAALRNFAAWLRQEDLTELQAAYVQTFDLTPEHSLHLTHHLFGDDKNRGPALIDLTEYYKEFGLETPENELPDFLPLILEFVSTLEPEGAAVFLHDTAKVLKVLAANLEKADSPYAPLLRMVESRGSLARLAA